MLDLVFESLSLVCMAFPFLPLFGLNQKRKKRYKKKKKEKWAKNVGNK